MDIQWIHRILIRDVEALKREIAAFPDDASVWAVRPGITNPAGTLALHIAGNLRHFVGAQLGGSDYLRDRPAEFATRDWSRDRLVAELDAAQAAIGATFGGGRLVDLTAQFPEAVGGYRIVTGDFLIHLAAHLAFHLGQVGYLRRIVTGSPTTIGTVSIPELATAVKVPAPTK